jgi:Flp pilus assembly protein TadD
MSSPPQTSRQTASITVDYPPEEAVFPPEITAPMFLWRDSSQASASWLIELSFSDGLDDIRLETSGERLRTGEIDPRCVAETNQMPSLTPLEASARSWKPDEEMWITIKRRSTERPARLTITGFARDQGDVAVSRGSVRFQTSGDPVGAPVFYRDVPLMPSELEKGVIKPIVPSAVPLISWRLRYLGESRSRLLMEGLPTCANCHSFSLDGKTLGMDVDGPQNDKGMYAIVPIIPRLSIRNEHVFSWNSFPDQPPGHRTIGFMAQVSPDGRHAVTTLNEAMYVVNFKDYRFLQVFFPTRGILAWYDRATQRIKALPGADNPNFVQTDGFWSPDGRSIVFARATAKDPYPRSGKLPSYAGASDETSIQYDLYRIPFNEGKGGRPRPIAGASDNGMSNTFPKVSPDGRWIVFVRCRNGQLMRPDGQLYIVPFEGGQARRMRCNTPLMNSWHSFSPNGRWLVFSSKGRSPYTQMYLTHLDENGHDSPPILIENATVANRAVNLPEFLNIPPEGLVQIDVPAADFYRHCDRAWELGEKGQLSAAIAEWKAALQISPEDARAHNNLGIALLRNGNPDEAIAHWQKAVELKPDYLEAYNNLGVALVRRRSFGEAAVQFRKVLELRPDSAVAHNNLGQALAGLGKTDAAIKECRKALSIDPGLVEARNDLAASLYRKGRGDEAIAHWEQALAIKPAFVQARFSLGNALYSRGQTREALVQWRQGLRVDSNQPAVLERLAWVLATAPAASLRNGVEAVEFAERAVRLGSGGEPLVLDTLAAAYAEAGRFADAAQTVRQALDLAAGKDDFSLARELRVRLALYEAGRPFRTSGTASPNHDPSR